MLTEAEAQTKWCPHAQEVRFPRIEDRNALDKCIGSACMAWRWFDTVTDDGTLCQLKPTPMVARTPLPTESPLDARRGYCGLAGKP